jgi:23S rRNA (uracil1939-C5)-methyltransferase
MPPYYCPSFDKKCGGCQWLNMDYNSQLKNKQKIQSEALAQSGMKISGHEQFEGMAKPCGCRNKMSLLNSDGRLVFTRENSNKPVDIEDCLMELDANRKVFKKIKKYSWPPDILQVHIRSTGDGKTGVCFFVKRMSGSVIGLARRIMKDCSPSVTGVGASSYRSYSLLTGSGYLKIVMGGITYSVAHNGFFQTNYLQAEFLRKEVLELMGESGGDKVLDLYCGSGFFSLPISRRAGFVLGIDYAAQAVKSAVMNASINRIENCDFIPGDVEAALKHIRPGEFATVILDPPREGCGIGVINELLRIGPGKMIYISCSVQSLSAELRQLKNKYRAVYCRLIDMFPQTLHMETVIKLVKE